MYKSLSHLCPGDGVFCDIYFKYYYSLKNVKIFIYFFRVSYFNLFDLQDLDQGLVVVRVFWIP